MMKLNDCSATFNMVVEQTMQYYRHNKTQILCGGDIDKRFSQLVQRCTNWAVRANLWDYSTYKDNTTKEFHAVSTHGFLSFIEQLLFNRIYRRKESCYGRYGRISTGWNLKKLLKTVKKSILSLRSEWN